MARKRGARGPRDVWLALAIAGIALTAIWGAFVAGLDAGHIHPTFPLMDGRLIPPEVFSLSPWIVDLTGNPVTVQFVHRWLGDARPRGSPLAAVARPARARAAERRPFDLLAGMALVQAGLGVATLLLGVPLVAAALHQAGAVVLLSLAIYALHAGRGVRV